MSDPIQRVVPPAEARAWEKRLQVRRWMNARGWDPAPRYGVIDRARESLLALGQPELADDPATIVTGIFQYLLRDEKWLEYVEDTAKQTLTDPTDCEGAARAYAWFLLQRYNRDLGGQDD